MLAALVVTLGLGVGIAVAEIPDSETDVITGCYQKNTGQLRVIDAEAGDTCLNSEVQLEWNQQGVAGEDGEDGAPGIVLAIYRVDEATATNGTDQKFADPMCAPGDKVVGGGWSLAPFDGDNRADLADHINVIENQPLAPGATEGWRTRAMEVPTPNGLNEDWQLRAHALCADTTP